MHILPYQVYTAVRRPPRILATDLRELTGNVCHSRVYGQDKDLLFELKERHKKCVACMTKGQVPNDCDRWESAEHGPMTHA